MIKLIAIDLDGSLLTEDKRLPVDFGEVMNVVFEKKITVVIASGRPYHNISTVFETLKKQLYFACDNGSYVVYDNQEIFISPLKSEAIKTFVELSRHIKNTYTVLCGKDRAYIEDTDENFKEQALKYYQQFEIVEDLSKVEDIIVKISLCDLNGAETNSYPFYKKFDTDFKIAVAGEIWLDITNIDASKGAAIKEIQKRLNITPDETLVFGDFLNDLDMIQDAGFSYAMKNAHPKILESAKYITEFDNNNGGVTHTIKKLIGIEGSLH